MSAIATGRLSVAPLPTWVDHVNYDPRSEPPDVRISDGLCFLQRDNQIDLTGETRAEYNRLLYRIVTQAGAEQASRFSALFDPTLQRMEVHHVRVIRGDRVIEHARPETDFDQMRREQNLERRILDGRLTVSLIIPDVRPGDVIEQCWTVHGGNPVLAGLHSDWVAFEGDVWEVRQRLLAPENRRFATRAFGTPPQSSSTTANGVTDMRWWAHDCRKVEVENLTPSWQMLARSLQIAEQAEWADVAALFAPLYRTDTMPDALKQEADAIAARHPGDPAARALAALRLVRERLRYLSLSLGEGGLVPRSVEQVWTTGYGDCKDSARLFAGLCSLLGVDAVCTLVHTRYGPALGKWLPSPGVFDHCIVRVRIGGKTYWIDPTRRALEPTLDDLFNPHLGGALPLLAEGATLEQMEVPEAPLVLDKLEKLSFGRRPGLPATLELRIVYHGFNADWMRGMIANQGLADVAKKFLERYQESWRNAAEKEALRVEDDTAANRVTLRAVYTIPNAWTDKGEMAHCYIPAQEIAHDLAPLQVKGERQNDVHLGTVRSLRRRLDVELPRNVPVNLHDDVKRVHGLKFWEKLTSPEKKRIVQQQELTISAPSCPPQQAQAYADIAKELSEHTGLGIRMAISGDKFKRERWWRFPSFGWRQRIALIWLILVLLNFLAHIAKNPQ